MATRLDRALNVRDAVLAWLLDNGRDEMLSGFRVRGGEVAPFRFIYRTPFSRIPLNGLKPRNFGDAALMQRRGPGNLPYALDVWWAGRKVMSLEWDHDGSLDLASFAKGDWDAQLLDVVDPGAAARPPDDTVDADGLPLNW
jgi:hypothetical protein